MSSLERLAEMLHAQGGLMSGLLPAKLGHQRDVLESQGPAQIAAAGPRAEGNPEEYELLIDAIYEGYLLHYGAPRLLCPPEADLGLLAGDQLYALGLARLVALGDLQAVAELADVITLSSLAQGAGEDEFAGAIWIAGARTVGWGPSEPYRQAKELAFARSAKATAAMLACASS